MDSKTASVMNETDLAQILDKSLGTALQHYNVAHTLVSETESRSRGQCPFCRDLRSFVVNTASNRWRCYACRSSGNAVKLVRVKSRLGQADAIRFIITELLRLNPSIATLAPAARSNDAVRDRSNSERENFGWRQRGSRGNFPHV